MPGREAPYLASSADIRASCTLPDQAAPTGGSVGRSTTVNGPAQPPDHADPNLPWGHSTPESLLRGLWLCCPLAVQPPQPNTGAQRQQLPLRCRLRTFSYSWPLLSLTFLCRFVARSGRTRLPGSCS